MIRNSRQLNTVFQDCVDPEIHHIEGKAKSKIDTGLDSHLHNFYTAEIRRKDREKELNRRK